MPLILFCLSALVLTLEVLETKIFAYSLSNNLIFLVVGVVLLGFGAGGTVLSLRKTFDNPRPLVRKCLICCAVLLVFAHGWFAVLSDQLVFAFDFRAFVDLRGAVDVLQPLITTLSILVLLASPYFFAGMAISAMLADPKGSVHLRYGINLLGSALGCVTIFFVLGPMTGPECLAACAIACALLAVPLYKNKVVPLVLIALIGTPTFAYSNRILPYQIQSAASSGQLALIIQNANNIVQAQADVQEVSVNEEYDRWDPTARVQVHSLGVKTTNPQYTADLERLPSKWFTQDSSYGSPLIGAGQSPEGTKAVFERTCYGIGYFRKKPKPDVLVIGLGGAPDVQTAIHHAPNHIDGVDINHSTVDMVKSKEIAKFLGHPYSDKRLTIHIRDGRSFARASKSKYDLIQLSGVDTKSVLASGTLALNESYLYTLEAIADYVALLKDDGILCILYAGDALRDRFAVTAMHVLRKAGSANPHKHLMMASQSGIFCFLVKKTPFTQDECKQMDKWIEYCDSEGKVDAAGNPVLDEITGISVLVYELLTSRLSLNAAPKSLFIPDGRDTEIEVMNKARLGKAELDAFVTNYTQTEKDWRTGEDVVLRKNISPVPDSRPFFFNIVPNDRVLAELWTGNADTIHFREMVNLLLIMMVLSVILITGPLIVFSMRGVVGAWRNLPFSVYFACLGGGFILAMSGLIQRYVLFLGHQGYAFPVVIGGLLLAAGLGSMLAGVFKKNPQRVMVVAALWICAALAAIHFFLDPLFNATADREQIERIGVALLALVPLGIPLGMMFPTGLNVVRKTSPMFVPWAFGINGVFSVIGSMIVLPGSILYGFPNMSIAAGVVYSLAAAVGFPLARRAMKVA